MHGLDDMYLFKQVVDFGSISAASRSLRIPKSTLARRIAALEAQLGSPLFHRAAQGLLLTNFGRECHAHCCRLVEEADRVLDLADRRRETPSGFLHVIYPPSFGETVVEYLAAEFVRSEPKVQIHLEASTGLMDPRSVSADLVLHFAFEPLPDVDFVGRRLFENPFVLAAHPDLLRGRRAPDEPAALRGLPCVGFGPKASAWAWKLTSGRRSYTHRFTPALSTMQLTALQAAARMGVGVASLPLNRVEEDLARGRLVQLLPEWEPPPAILFAVYPSGRTLTAAARRFLTLVIDHFAETGGITDLRRGYEQRFGLTGEDRVSGED
ncbi:LysR substrate-binding domain-containing protein [Oceanicella sp. SM1341]|uniref:LysR substrate-binding domain-containing protein n=1 Tax=Oceanicella sp. SM1341 TaxID=1548889 RepID=UPI000E467DA8|nr:LysR substrate-binding domain-containing protein [Oceanicella sp. SM1341]